MTKRVMFRMCCCVFPKKKSFNFDKLGNIGFDRFGLGFYEFGESRLASRK